jgi:DNA invertase Pin-like site-specific DNA recombinase
MGRLAIAYVRRSEAGTASDARANADADVAAISAARGFELLAVMRDDRGGESGALAGALERVAAGEASTLLLARLAAPAGSLRELVALLDWLRAARADLVALDVRLDTGTAAGRRMVGVLREIERWEREPERARPPRGRPGLAATAPELSERIRAMRGEGLSLQAIADALNAEGVPTRRGGAQWRPSSVQAALGYRRPRPLPPGAPPPPPDRAGHRPSQVHDLPGRPRPPQSERPSPPRPERSRPPHHRRPGSPHPGRPGP